MTSKHSTFGYQELEKILKTCKAIESASERFKAMDDKTDIKKYHMFLNKVTTTMFNTIYSTMGKDAFEKYIFDNEMELDI